MKTKILLAIAVSLFLTFHSAFGQGSLTPPGAPGQTMKSLAQIEPRTPVSSLPQTISQPGSYYATTNLTGALTISSSGVTFDLMGFELVSASGYGIFVNGGRTNLVIRNGTIRGCGSSGVYAPGASNSRLERLNVWASGGNGFGIAVGYGSIISDCVCQSNAGVGIYAGRGCTITGCTAKNNGENGISIGMNSTISACTSADNSYGGIVAIDGCTLTSCTAYGNVFGISIQNGCTVKDCTANANSADGIQVANGFGGTTIRGCTARSNHGDGIEVYNACLVADNLCDGNGSGPDGNAGIHVTGIANRIDNNQISSSGYGIGVEGTGNLIIRNSATHNTTNYVISAGNNVGVTVVPPSSGALTGNTGGSGTGTTDPWANFSF